MLYLKLLVYSNTLNKCYVHSSFCVCMYIYIWMAGWIDRLDQIDQIDGWIDRQTDVYTVELSYNNLGLSDTSAIALYILWYQQIPHKACFSSLLSTTYIRASSSNITTLPIISSNIIFQEVGILERARPHCFQVATQIPGLQHDNSNGKFTLCIKLSCTLLLMPSMED